MGSHTLTKTGVTIWRTSFESSFWKTLSHDCKKQLTSDSTLGSGPWIGSYWSRRRLNLPSCQSCTVITISRTSPRSSPAAQSNQTSPVIMTVKSLKGFHTSILCLPLRSWKRNRRRSWVRVRNWMRRRSWVRRRSLVRVRWWRKGLSYWERPRWKPSSEMPLWSVFLFISLLDIDGYNDEKGMRTS